MNQTTISKQAMELLLHIIREKLLTLESTEMTGNDEQSWLRSLEDRLGRLSEKKHEITAIDYGTEFPSYAKS